MSLQTWSEGGCSSAEGLERGQRDFGIESGLIIFAMRNMNASLDMAESAVMFAIL
jgi:hypothetical protein